MRSRGLRRKVNAIEVEQFMRAVAQSPVSVLLPDYDGTLAPFCLNPTGLSPARSDGVAAEHHCQDGRFPRSWYAGPKLAGSSPIGARLRRLSGSRRRTICWIL